MEPRSLVSSHFSDAPKCLALLFLWLASLAGLPGSRSLGRRTPIWGEPIRAMQLATTHSGNLPRSAPASSPLPLIGLCAEAERGPRQGQGRLVKVNRRPSLSARPFTRPSSSHCHPFLPLRRALRGFFLSQATTSATCQAAYLLARKRLFHP